MSVLFAVLAVVAVSLVSRVTVACPPAEFEVFLLTPTDENVPLDAAFVIDVNYVDANVQVLLAPAGQAPPEYVLGDIRRIGDLWIFTPDELLQPDTDYEGPVTLLVKEPSPDLKLRACSVYPYGQYRCSETAILPI